MNRETSALQHGSHHGYGPRPAPQAIDDMDRVLVLLGIMRISERRLLWARANGVRWERLVHLVGRSRPSLNRDLKCAL